MPAYNTEEVIKMNAIQFEAPTENDTILIPEQFRIYIGKGKVHVTFLTDPAREPTDKATASILTHDDFMELKLSTKGLKFDREERFLF
jgi:hypothetical protein